MPVKARDFHKHSLQIMGQLSGHTFRLIWKVTIRAAQFAAAHRAVASIAVQRRLELLSLPPIVFDSGEQPRMIGCFDSSLADCYI